MCILCTDPSYQNRFILTVHGISCGGAVLLDQQVMAAWTRTRNMHFLKRPRLLFMKIYNPYLFAFLEGRKLFALTVSC